MLKFKPTTPAPQAMLTRYKKTKKTAAQPNNVIQFAYIAKPLPVLYIRFSSFEL